MVIGIWFLSLLILAACIAKAYEYALQKKKSLPRFDGASVDQPFGNLSVESPESVSFSALAMRGSWRLAQDGILSKGVFDAEKKTEYGKKL